MDMQLLGLDTQKINLMPQCILRKKKILPIKYCSKIESSIVGFDRSIALQKKRERFF